MDSKEWKELITELVREYVKEYPAKYQVPELWRTPLVGFADAGDPYIQSLRKLWRMDTSYREILWRSRPW